MFWIAVLMIAVFGQAGVRYWADSPENGPEGWGFRVAMIMILPK